MPIPGKNSVWLKIGPPKNPGLIIFPNTHNHFGISPTFPYLSVDEPIPWGIWGLCPRPRWRKCQSGRAAMIVGHVESFFVLHCFGGDKMGLSENREPRIPHLLYWNCPKVGAFQFSGKQCELNSLFFLGGGEVPDDLMIFNRGHSYRSGRSSQPQKWDIKWRPGLRCSLRCSLRPTQELLGQLLED